MAIFRWERNKGRCFVLLLTSLALFVSAQSFAQKGKIEKYSTFIYTSDDLPAEVQREIDACVSKNKQERGLISDMLKAGVSALQGIGAGYVTSVIDLSVNTIGKLMTQKSREKEVWEEIVRKENTFSMTIKTISEIDDFYKAPSVIGSMDPKGMKFNGIGCLKMVGNDTAIFVSCHVNRDKINRIVNHSKFELVLDTLLINPFHSDLPNTVLDIPFSFEERDHFILTLNMQILSSWMDQEPQMHRDQTLGEFVVTIPVRQEDLDTQGVLRYSRGEGEASKYAVVGESFIVPRSYMNIEGCNEYNELWGTGQYKMAVTLHETCEATPQYLKDWRNDYKRREAMTTKKTVWQKIVRYITGQKWDEITKTWVVTTLKAPAGVLTNEIIEDLHLIPGIHLNSAGSDGVKKGKQSEGTNEKEYR